MSSSPRSSSQAPSSPTSQPASAATPSSPDRLRRARDEEDEDLLDEQMHQRDYRAIPELDRYDDDELDSSEQAPISMHERRRAERSMRKRDAEEARREGRVPAALLDEDRPLQRRRLARDSDDEMMEGEEDEREEVRVSLDSIEGKLADWITRDATRNEVKRRFRNFLTSFSSDNDFVYPSRISKMCAANKQSLAVNYVHLSQVVPTLAIWVADAPTQMLEIFNESAREAVLALFPNYDQVHNEIYVRITGLPIVDSLRDLRQMHLNALVKVTGVVTRRTSVFPMLKVVTFNCVRCGETSQPFVYTGDGDVQPTRCGECASQGPWSVNHQQTVYRNFQRITLQETPGSVPAGRVPRQKDIVLLNDLIDTCRPGEEVSITGIYVNNYDTGLNVANGFPVFRTMIEANHVAKRSERLAASLTDEDVKNILKLSKRPDIAELIFNSIAPSIYGHENIKIALALSMFGGVAKRFENKHRIRGDINVLVLGDPGTAKSQFLKYAEKTAPRAVYTTGKGASAVGLTAAVRRDPLTREWTLEGGALVLADQGVCLIDEFDKMDDQDRTSIHEAMEQQSISISKAGIITTLQARCAVIAAANPVSGRYDTSASFAQNVDLTDAILSRFDVLCVVRDTVDPVVDERLADFVVGSHMRSHPAVADDSLPFEDAAGSGTDGTALIFEGGVEDAGRPRLSQAMLRKYIRYSREHCQPQLHSVDDDKLANLYSELRRESSASGGIPIAVRHIESMIRMAEAHAKLHLRDHVTSDDIDLAIRVMLESFVSTQKFSVMRQLRAKFDKYISHKRDSFQLLVFVLQQLVRENYQLLAADTEALHALERDGFVINVDKGDFEKLALRDGISRAELAAFYESSVFQARSFSVSEDGKNIQYAVTPSEPADAAAPGSGAGVSSSALGSEPMEIDSEF